jgi:hypothetical protein
MNVTELKEVCPYLTKDGMNKAYWEIVPQLRLELKAFPVMMHSEAIGISKDHPLEMLDGSPVKVKQISDIMGVNIVDSSHKNVSLGNGIIGDPKLEGYNYGSDFDFCNNYHEVVPEVYLEGNKLVCDNYDQMEGTPVMFWVTAYVYPFLTTDNSYVINSDLEELVPEIAILCAGINLANYFLSMGYYTEGSKVQNLMTTINKMFNQNVPPAYTGNKAMRQINTWG